MNKMDKIISVYWACYRFIRDYIFQPVWYRIFGHKHHIVRTGLTPAPWIDTDTRMLYAVMSLVEWFVENDMLLWTKEERTIEMARLSALLDHNITEVECLKAQWEAEDGIMEIYKWWIDYPNRQNKINEAMNKWYEYVYGFQKDKDDFMEFFNAKDNMDEYQLKTDDELEKSLRDMEAKLEREEQEMLEKAIELRGYMWS